MPAPELEARLEGGVPPVVVLAGAERWFREQGLRSIVGRVLPEGDPGGAFVRVDARLTPDQVAGAVDELRTGSLFGDGKVVLVENPECAELGGGTSKESPIARLAAAALAPPPPAGVLVLSTSKGVKGRDAVPTATVSDAGALVVDCRTLYDAPGPWQRGAAPHDHELARFLSGRMSRVHGKRLPLPEAHALTRLVGSDLGELDGALNALALYLGPRAAVALDDVAAAVGATRTDPAWHLVDAVFEGDVRRALDLLLHARTHGLADARGGSIRGDDALLGYLGASLHGRFRRTLAAAEGLARGDPADQVARRLGVPGFRQQAELQRCHVDPARLLAAHEAFLEAEAGTKSGRVPANVALDRLVVSLVTELPVGGRA